MFFETRKGRKERGRRKKRSGKKGTGVSESKRCLISPFRSLMSILIVLGLCQRKLKEESTANLGRKKLENATKGEEKIKL